VHHGARLDDGRTVTAELVRQCLREELERVRADLGPEGFAQARYEEAAAIIEDISTRPSFTEFMTTVAYQRLD
jgi:malate synthase